MPLVQKWRIVKVLGNTDPQHPQTSHYTYTQSSISTPENSLSKTKRVSKKVNPGKVKNAILISEYLYI